MPPVPLLKPRKVIRAFERLGWSVARRQGSHAVMTKPGNPATLSIPEHDEVARGTLRSLITAAGITVDEFVAAVE